MELLKDNQFGPAMSDITNGSRQTGTVVSGVG